MNNPDILKELIMFAAFMLFGGLLVTQAISYGLDYINEEIKSKQKKKHAKNKMDSQRRPVAGFKFPAKRGYGQKLSNE